MQVRHTRAAARAAFTLTEMLIVVAIIVVLAGIGGAILIPQLDKAKESAAKIQAKAVAAECEKWYADYDDYPTTVDQLIQGDEKNGNRPRMEQNAVLDPWGQKYNISQQDNSGKVYVSTQHKGKTFSNLDR
jgi:prepilin-type N-terminal cleavage/methylation domain-containing protein